MVLAHVGHILIDGPLFLGPVVMLVGALWLSGSRHKRAERRRRAAATADPLRPRVDDDAVW